MKTKLIVFFPFLFLLSCQPLKLITKETNGKISEEYYVKRSDKSIKYGKYISYFTNYNSQYIKEKGYYKNGLKDSSWVEYKSPKRSKNSFTYGEVKTEGKYKNGEKVGIWLTYRKAIISRYDYTNKIKLSPFVVVSLNYPKKAIEMGVQGTVTVSYEVDSDCTIKNIKIIKSLSPECDSEVVLMLKRMSELMIQYGVDCKNDTIIKDFNFKISN